MMKQFYELPNGQFFEKITYKSGQDRYFLKVSPKFAFRVKFYPHRGDFIIDPERVKLDIMAMTYPLTITKGRAYRSKLGGDLCLVAQGYGK